MRKATVRVLYCAALIMFLSASLFAQDAKRPEEPKAPRIIARRPEVFAPPIKSDVNLVVVWITVTDSYGRLVTGLTADNFEVFDNKVPQKFESFSAEDAPASIGFVHDNSGSMADKIEKTNEAIMEFIKTSNPNDEFVLVSFDENGHPLLRSGLTAKPGDIISATVSEKGKGKTPLVDAIYLALEEIKKGATQHRRALLVISDGGDNNSRYTWSDLKRSVREADVQIYAIGIFEPIASRARTPEEAAGPSNLAELAEVSGGLMFSVEDARELPDIAEKISEAIRQQYVITYKPSNLVRDGRWRKIKVKLHPPPGLPPLNVYSRQGYYAPTN